MHLIYRQCTSDARRCGLFDRAGLAVLLGIVNRIGRCKVSDVSAGSVKLYAGSVESSSAGDLLGVGACNRILGLVIAFSSCKIISTELDFHEARLTSESPLSSASS